HSFLSPLMCRRPSCFTLFPYTTLFRSGVVVPNVFTPDGNGVNDRFEPMSGGSPKVEVSVFNRFGMEIFSSSSLTNLWNGTVNGRSEEHTSELQSRENLVCRLLLEKKKK